jgi:hypothetical protein
MNGSTIELLASIFRCPGWTLNMKIQDHIDIYLSGGTFNEVKRSFPYLVSKDFATGGGDVCYHSASQPP